MAIFEEVVLVWGDKEYRIPPTGPGGVLQAIAAVEEVISMGELGQAAATRDYPIAKMSKAFGRLLRFAGAKVEDDEVYAGMFDDAKDMPRRVMDTLHTLQLLMIPPKALRGDGKKPEAGTEAVASSPPATNSSSAPG